MDKNFVRLTPGQVVEVIKAARTLRDRALLSVMYNAALRRGEVQGLRISDYNPKSGTLMVGRLKKGITQEIELLGWVCRALDEYLKERETRHVGGDALFQSRKGLNPMSGQAVYYVYRNAAVWANLDKTYWHPHCLRHSFASHLASCSVGIEIIQRSLGHVNLNGTGYYTNGAYPKIDLRTLENNPKMANPVSYREAPTGPGPMNLTKTGN